MQKLFLETPEIHPASLIHTNISLFLESHSLIIYV
jgi:hypothetical protein